MKHAISFVVVVLLLLSASELEAREYVVRRGDTLSNISQAQLGTARRWREIAALNNIPAPHSLKIGQVLTLPDDGAGGWGGELVLPVPMDPQLNVDAPETQSSGSRAWESLPLPKNLWLWGILALLVLWAFSALCIRVGCWFALVETSFQRCVFLALLHACLLILFLAALAFMFGMLVSKEMSPIVWPAAVGLLVIVDLAISAAITKRVLDCKWRSVLTIGVMAHFVADLLAAGVMLILLAVFR